MSAEAISWALNLAPVPVGRGGQPSSECKFVPVGLAIHAGPDGTGGGRWLSADWSVVGDRARGRGVGRGRRSRR